MVVVAVVEMAPVQQSLQVDLEEEEMVDPIIHCLLQEQRILAAVAVAAAPMVCRLKLVQLVVLVL